MNTTIKNERTGELTKYGLSCGYVQRYEAIAVVNDVNECVELYKEGGVYHVKFWSVPGARNGRPIVWNSYDTYGPARAFIKQIRAAMFPPVYYQVRPESNGVRCAIRHKGMTLIGGELFTEKELTRLVNAEFISKHFAPIYIPHGSRPYWFFGSLRKPNAL